ncbi:MAG TPA: hypothetical protein QKA14_00835 [Candidatus Megaira endosymbiont of Hartmannula sinica]|nr:hypothetical protein [Candidatus Megaera endosymbiont of Hartmannula sinica]
MAPNINTRIARDLAEFNRRELFNLKENPNAHSIDAKIVNSSRAGGVAIQKINKIRLEDVFAEKRYGDALGEMEATQLTYQTLDNLYGKLFSGDSKNSIISTSIDNFFSLANSLGSKKDITTGDKRSFINGADNLIRVFNKLSKDIKQIKQSKFRDINRHIVTANNVLKELNSLNKKISTTSNIDHRFTLYDKRDTLLKKLSVEIPINYNTDDKGRVDIYIKNTTNQLLSKEGGVASLGLSRTKEDNNSFKLEYSLRNKQAIINSGVLFNSTNAVEFNNLTGVNDETKEIPSGAILSIASSVINILGEQEDKINNIKSSIVSQVNAAFSSHVSTNLEDKRVSSKKISLSDECSFSDFNIYTVGNDLTSIKTDSSNSLGKIIIDTDKYQINNYVDLVNVFNKQMGDNLTNRKFSIGEIVTGENNATNKFLINNITTENTTIEDNNDDGTQNISFNIQMMGNEFFGSKVRVLKATKILGENSVDLTDNEFVPFETYITKGENNFLSEKIYVDNINRGDNIDFEVEIIGDNGHVERKKIRIGTDSDRTNDTGNINLDDIKITNPEMEGYVEPTSPLNGSPIAQMYFQNGNGDIIDHNIAENINEEAYLVVKSFSKDKNVIIDNTSFNIVTGFNDFFSYNENNGDISIKDKFYHNPDNLPAFNMRSNISSSEVTMVGSTKARLTLGEDTVAIERITADKFFEIAGERFSFTNIAPDNENIVPLGHDQLSSLQNLVTAINNHPSINSIIEARLDGGVDKLILEAKVAGSSSNEIGIETNLVEAVLGNDLNINLGYANPGEDTPQEIDNNSYHIDKANFNISSSLEDIFNNGIEISSIQHRSISDISQEYSEEITYMKNTMEDRTKSSEKASLIAKEELEKIVRFSEDDIKNKIKDFYEIQDLKMMMLSLEMKRKRILMDTLRGF